jgi:hypothetical protein
MTSGFLPKADTVTAGRHVSKVPIGDMNLQMKPPTEAALLRRLASERGFLSATLFN